VLYADLVGTDQAPHTPGGWFGPAQHFVSLFPYFFVFFSAFSFLRFFKAKMFLNSKFQNLENIIFENLIIFYV
jgi:hypothetical protein